MTLALLLIVTAVLTSAVYFMLTREWRRLRVPPLLAAIANMQQALSELATAARAAAPAFEKFARLMSEVPRQ